MPAIWNRFDQRLFALKLQEPALRMHAETASRRRRIQFECRRAGRSKGAGLFLALVDSDLEVLRRYVEGDVDRICREVWQTQGNPITAEFVRGCVVQNVFTALEARASAIKASIERMAARMHFSHSLHPVHKHLVHATGEMKFILSNRYEIEARELEWKDAGEMAEEKERKGAPNVHRVTQALPPPKVVGGLGWVSRPPKPTQVPEDLPPYYPKDLKPQTRLILGEAVRKFPVQTQALELCRYVLSELTPHFSAAVQSEALRADRIEDVMNGLLHYILVSNCGDSDERFSLAQKARKSDEWLNLSREGARVAADVAKEVPTQSENLTTLEFTPHIPLSNPLTARDDGNSTTVDVESFAMALPQNRIHLDAGSITSLAYETLYNIYFDDPDFGAKDTAGATYQASVAKIRAGFGGRFFVGSILTSAKGGPPTIGNADGGTFRLAGDGHQVAQPPPALATEMALVATGKSRVAELQQGASPQGPSGTTGDEPRTRRESFVLPMLAKKGWSIHDWATESNVDFHTANDYLKGKTNAFRSTRKKLADSLGVGVEKLPQ